MNTTHRIIALTMVLAVMTVLGCKSPEEKLIAHYENMTEIIKEADEPSEGLEDLHDYMLANGAEASALEHDIAVELQGIEDKGDRADRWEEHAEALADAKKDFKEEKSDFMNKEVCDDKEARSWCKDYNKGWEKIKEKLQEDGDKLAGVSGYIRGCPEDECRGGN